MELVFATHNENKVIEIKNLIHDNIKILSLSDIVHSFPTCFSSQLYNPTDIVM